MIIHVLTLAFITISVAGSLTTIWFLRLTAVYNSITRKTLAGERLTRHEQKLADRL